MGTCQDLSILKRYMPSVHKSHFYHTHCCYRDTYYFYSLLTTVTSRCVVSRQVRGFALRDEFSCPITRELMRDPVIAADGHTYDREAIEMWLRNHDTSPKVRTDTRGKSSLHMYLVLGQACRRFVPFSPIFQ